MAETTSANAPTLTTRIVEQRGVMLPWERWTPPKVYDTQGVDCTPERPDPPQLLNSGEVFVPLSTLEEVACQGRWDSQYGSALVLTATKKYALVAAGWAREETRGGIHGTDALRQWLNQNCDCDFELTEAGSDA